MSEIISTGKTVDEAIDEGCRILGVSKDECNFEILELPAKKLFRTIPAKVRITKREDDFSLKDMLTGFGEPEKTEEKPVKKAEKKQKPEKSKQNKETKEQDKPAKETEEKAEKKEQKKAEPKKEEPAKEEAQNENKEEAKAPSKNKKKKKKPAKDKKPAEEKETAKEAKPEAEGETQEESSDSESEILSYLTEEELPERAVNALQYLKQIVAALGFEKVEYAFGKTERGVRFILSGEDAPSLIGRRGETMDALQYLCTVGSSREGGDYCRISIDIEGYRSRREESLTELAAKTAAKVKKNGYKQTLEPMNPYERRIVHAAIQEIEGVTSYSVGSEPYRKVVVALEGAAGSERKGGRRNGKKSSGKSQSSRSHEPREPKEAKENREEKKQNREPVKAGQAYEMIGNSAPLPKDVRKAPIPVKKELKPTEEFMGALYGKIEL